MKMSLDTLLLRAEALFYRFKRTVYFVDRMKEDQESTPLENDKDSETKNKQLPQITDRLRSLLKTDWRECAM